MSDIPYGYCRCGCGEKTPIATRTNASIGKKRGEPTRFVSGHYKRRDAVARFFLKVAMPEDPDGCWNWTAADDGNGYGLFGVNSRHVRAHRYAYELIRGDIPPGLVLDHLCRNPSCVNPWHLEPVPQVENIRRGEVARLTMEDAREIRRQYTRSPLISVRDDLASEFGVTPGYVLEIVNGRAWREDESEAA